MDPERQLFIRRDPQFSCSHIVLSECMAKQPAPWTEKLTASVCSGSQQSNAESCLDSGSFFKEAWYLRDEQTCLRRRWRSIPRYMTSDEESQNFFRVKIAFHPALVGANANCIMKASL